MLAHFLGMWPFSRAREKACRGQEQALQGDLKSEVLHVSLLLPEVHFHLNFYSGGCGREWEEGWTLSLRQGCDIRFALTSSEPLGMCLLFSDSQIKHL